MSNSQTKLPKMARKGEAGLTLIEALIAMSILTVGMLAIAQLQGKAIWANDLSSTNTAALNLAQDQLERIINMDYNDSDLDDTQTGNNGDLTDTTTVDQQLTSGKYTIIWNVAANTPITDTKTVVVMVTWANGLHSRTLNHIKSLAD